MTGGLFPRWDVVFDVPGHAPVIYLARGAAGHEAVVTWLGNARYTIDVAAPGGRRLQREAACATVEVARATATGLALTLR